MAVHVEKRPLAVTWQSDGGGNGGGDGGSDGNDGRIPPVSLFLLFSLLFVAVVTSQ